MSATEVLQSPQKLTSQQLRKIKKPMIEKRRRERINESLNQLKALVLEALNKDESQYNKMEKADILEMTVKHLKGLQSRLAKGLVSSQPNMVTRYKTGYKECADEVTRYLGSIPNVHPQVKDNLNEHLSFCSQKVQHYSSANNQAKNANELTQNDNVVKNDGQHITTTAVLPGQIMNSIHVGALPVVNGSQSMMLATTGPISPIHGTSQGFVPVIISPNNSVSVISPVQAQQQSHHHHHQVQTSPLPGSVIPLYSHASLPINSNCRSPPSNVIQSHNASPPAVVFTKDNSNQQQGQTLQQNHRQHSSPKLSYNSPSSPMMAEDVPQNNFPHHPEESFVSAQALDFVDSSKHMKTRDFYNHQTNIGGINTLIISPNQQQQRLSSPVSYESTKLQHTWSDYAKDLHKYGREVLVHSPNGSPVWRPW